jgi:hypothetical protein
MKILDKPRYKVVGDITPFGERDNVQARNTLESGSQEYSEKPVYGKFRPHPVPSLLEDPEPIWKKYKKLL